jgi:hypothetical protein
MCLFNKLSDALHSIELGREDLLVRIAVAPANFTGGAKTHPLREILIGCVAMFLRDTHRLTEARQLFSSLATTESTMGYR